MQYKEDNNDLKIILELYKSIVEEYRFQINLNWDRNKFYVLLNSGLITATCGLLRIPGFAFAEFLTIPLFVLGLLASWIGLTTLLKGIEYRRRIVYQKSQIEEKLSQFTTEQILPIQTTKGMREAKEVDFDKFMNRPPRLGTISYFLAILFVLLMAVNGVALIYLLFSLRGQSS